MYENEYFERKTIQWRLLIHGPYKMVRALLLLDGHITLVLSLVGQSPYNILNLILLSVRIKRFMVIITELALALLICAFSGNSDLSFTKKSVFRTNLQKIKSSISKDLSEIIWNWSCIKISLKCISLQIIPILCT